MLSDALRRAVSEHENITALAEATGVHRTQIHRFLAGYGISLTSADRLAEVLELEIRPKQKKRRGGA